MSVTASPAQTAPRPSPSTAGFEIEASCRLPLLVLFGGGALWFGLAMLFALMASLKFHNPHFLADCACLTYGRVHAVHVSALLYGFGVPAALGSGLWILCRLGRAPLFAPMVALTGTAIWNFAVLFGVGGILCGGGTGVESFAMPSYVSVLLLAAYLLIAVCGLMTFHGRNEETVYPSQWFVLGAFFWFPWIFTTAVAMLQCMPVRGVLQASVAWWYAHNLSTVFFSFAGLASIFYFVPKLLGRPLHSYHLAALAFWTLALFGSWGGIPVGAPLPSWIISLSVAGAILTTIPVLAVTVNFFQTVRKDLNVMDRSFPVRFAYVALVFWLVASVQQIVSTLPSVSVLTNYTWFNVAQWNLFHYGFFALAIFGAIYYVTPRLLNAAKPPEWSPGLLSGHFWFTFFGVLLSYIALVVGGVGQGYLLNDPSYGMDRVVAGTLMGLRVDTLGDVLIIIGAVLFLLNFVLMLSRHYRPLLETELRKALS